MYVVTFLRIRDAIQSMGNPRLEGRTSVSPKGVSLVSWSQRTLHKTFALSSAFPSFSREMQAIKLTYGLLNSSLYLNWTMPYAVSYL